MVLVEHVDRKLLGGIFSVYNSSKHMWYLWGHNQRNIIEKPIHHLKNNVRAHAFRPWVSFIRYWCDSSKTSKLLNRMSYEIEGATIDWLQRRGRIIGNLLITNKTYWKHYSAVQKYKASMKLIYVSGFNLFTNMDMIFLFLKGLSSF